MRPALQVLSLRNVPLFILATGLVFSGMVSNAVIRADEAQSSPTTITQVGQVEAIVENQLTIQLKDGVSYTHEISEETEITLNREQVKLEDLYEGDWVQITLPIAQIPAEPEPIVIVQGAALSVTAIRPGRKLRRLLKEHPGSKLSLRMEAVLAPSPGEGAVAVVGVEKEGPAGQAGIQQGDYLLEMNGTDIASLDELMKTLEQTKPDQQMSLLVWRQGQEFVTQVSFGGGVATHNVYLGTTLVDIDGPGVVIVSVDENSPASQTGLRPGDLILEVAGTPIESPEDFGSEISQYAPGDDVVLVIQRPGLPAAMKISPAEPMELPETEEQTEPEADEPASLIIPESSCCGPK